MKNKEIISQLESIKEDSRSHIDLLDEEDIWSRDIIALDRAIQVFQRKENKSHDVGMKILFVVNIFILLGAAFLILTAIGGLDSGTLNKQEFLIRIVSDILVIFLSGASLSMIWRGVGNE